MRVLGFAEFKMITVDFELLRSLSLSDGDSSLVEVDIILHEGGEEDELVRESSQYPLPILGGIQVHNLLNIRELVASLGLVVDLVVVESDGAIQRPYSIVPIRGRDYLIKLVIIPLVDMLLSQPSLRNPGVYSIDPITRDPDESVKLIQLSQFLLRYNIIDLLITSYSELLHQFLLIEIEVAQAVALVLDEDLGVCVMHQHLLGHYLLPALVLQLDGFHFLKIRRNVP